MGDCQFCNDDEVCPGEHCLVELSDVLSFMRERGTQWNDHPVAITPEVKKMERFAGRMLLTIADDLEKKYRPESQQACKSSEGK